MKTLINIKYILDEIIAILSSIGESNWHDALKNFRNRCDSIASSEDQKKLITDIMRIYGGMGSFSDLILYKNGQLMEKETSQLDVLRSKLFETAKNLR
jgi:hypothetical protein